MRLPKPQIDNVNNMCIVENLVHMNRKQGGVDISWDRYVFTLTISFLSCDLCISESQPSLPIILAGMVANLN
jgi:hypothetical protein